MAEAKRTVNVVDTRAPVINIIGKEYITHRVGDAFEDPGVFAYDIIDGKMIIKTYINFNLLSEDQVHKFYGSGTATVLPKEYIAEDLSQSDFKLIEEHEGFSEQPFPEQF